MVVSYLMPRWLPIPRSASTRQTEPPVPLVFPGPGQISAPPPPPNMPYGMPAPPPPPPQGYGYHPQGPYGAPPPPPPMGGYNAPPPPPPGHYHSFQVSQARTALDLHAIRGSSVLHYQHMMPLPLTLSPLLPLSHL